MNSFTFPHELLRDSTQIFEIERNHSKIGSVHGFFCGHKYPNTIQLVENTDIKNGDWLIDTLTGQRYYAKDVRPIIVGGTPVDWMVSYLTEQSFNAENNINQQTTININSVSGNSVIGNQKSVIFNAGSSIKDIEQLIADLPNTDKEEAQKLVDILKTTEEANHPVLVEGALSKFSNLLKKHTDLLVAVGGWAVQLLIGK